MTQPSLISRYADRLGFDGGAPELQRRTDGTTAQVLELLDDILLAHTQAICFENLDVVAYRVRGELRAVPLDLDAVADKLLDAGRGGYCHEHAVLIRGVLTELGLSAYPVLARVHLGDDRAAPGGATHQVTIVDVGGRKHLVDPGFGGGTPEAALEVSESAGARTTPHGEHRLVPAQTALDPGMRADSDWVLQSRTREDQDFRSVYAFSDHPRQHADLELSNWFTSTKPGTRFTGPPILARSLPAGGKVTLEGRRLRRAPHSGHADEHERSIAGAADFAEVLSAEFGLAVDRELSDLVWTAVPDD